jgi:hypothetical protein
MNEIEKALKAASVSMQIIQSQENLAFIKRSIEYCECWLSEHGTGDNREAAESDLSFMQDVVKTLEQKIKELEADESLILQNNPTE